MYYSYVSVQEYAVPQHNNNSTIILMNSWSMTNNILVITHSVTRLYYSYVSVHFAVWKEDNISTIISLTSCNV